ncbi:MAG: hypothetical protein KJ601_00090 [Nanoarchaeota archaeon]|nr:hypothetical protein [Nanoarchaeota archaeon]MBU1703858.1 hypothetical protein [Nanoarchaeota archaeon]
MYLEKKRVDSYSSILDELKTKVSRPIEPSIHDINISLTDKREKLLKQLRRQLIYTYQNPELKELKDNLIITREIVKKIRDINFYINILKHTRWPYRLGVLEKRRLKFVEKQIKRGLRNIKLQAPKTRRFNRKNHLKRQSALLMSLEAKLPPPELVHSHIFDVWQTWQASTFSLMSALEVWFDDGIKINETVKDIIKERADNLKKEEAHMALSQNPKKTKAWSKAVTLWMAAKEL